MDEKIEEDYFDPLEFLEYVESVLKNEWMGDEIIEERLWGETPFGQHFVLVISKVVWFAVRLIVDEEYRHLKVARKHEVYSDGVLKKKEFRTLENAKNYAKKKQGKLEKGVFGKKFAYRIRKLPLDAFENFERYLKCGDHIQRTLDGFSSANHEGVYIGDGMIAHINTEKSIAIAKTLIAEKLEAHARIDPFQGFLSFEKQEVRIVVHCLRRKSRADIRSTATRLADNDVTPEERYNSGEYNFLKQNCQHFASYCVLGVEYMSDKGPLLNRIVIKAATLMGTAVVDPIISRKKQKRIEAKTTSETSFEMVEDDENDEQMKNNIID